MNSDTILVSSIKCTAHAGAPLKTLKAQRIIDIAV